jgi:hypothetical protein
MSDEAGTQPAARPKRYFRAKSSQPQISREAAEREGAILRVAVETLGLQGAQAFLNGHNDQLDGRPLAIAAGSIAGFNAVSATIVSTSSTPTTAA